MAYKHVIALGLALMAAGCGEHHYTTEEHLVRATEFRAKGDLATALLELKNATQQAPEDPVVRIALGDLQMLIGDGFAARKEYEAAIRHGADEEKLTLQLARAAYLVADYQAILDRIMSEVIDARDALAALANDQKAELLAIRALAHYQTGTPDRAQELADQAIGFDPESPAARHAQAILTAYHQDYATTRDLLTRLVTDHPQYPAAWALLGDLEQFEGNLEAAETAFTNAISYEPRLSRLFRQNLLKRGVVRVFLGKTDDALADAQLLKRAAPKEVGSQYLRGLVAVQSNDLDTALIELTGAVATSPEHMPSKYYLGLVEFRRGNRQQSIRHLEDYVSASKMPTTADRLLAVAYLQEREFEQAEKLLQRILRVSPNDEMALTLLSQIVLPRGQDDAAIALLEQVLATTDQVAGAHINLGRTLLVTGDTNAAIQQFDEAIAADPEIPRAGELKVAALVRQGRFAEALAAADELGARFPDNPGPVVLRGAVFQAQGETQLARDNYQRALDLSPGNLAASRSYAALLIEQQEFDEARGVLEAALKANPDNLQVLLGLAEIATHDGDIAKTRQWVERAMSSHPDSLQPFIHMARYLVTSGRPAEAIATLDKVAQQHGNDPVYLGLRGEAELAANQIETAVTTFSQLIRKSPDSAHGHYLLARAYSRLNARDRALESVKRALTLEPGHLLAQIMYTRLLFDANRVGEAKSQLAALRDRYPNHPEVIGLEGWLNLAEHKPKEAMAAFERAAAVATSGALIQDLAAAQAQAGDWNTSIATLENWLDKNPEDVGVRHSIAELHLFFHRDAEAIAQFEIILKATPDSPTVLNNLAWLKRHTEPDVALAHIDKALQLAPQQSAFLDTRGLILLELGKIDAALAALGDAVAGNPDNNSYRTHLAQALIMKGDTQQAAKVLRAVLDTREPFDELATAQALLKQTESP